MKRLAPMAIILFWLVYAMSWPFLFAISLVIWLVTYPFDKRRLALHKFICIYFTVFLKGMPLWKVTVTGKENIDKTKQYVFVCNHQSQLDSFLFHSLLIPFKIVVRKELYKVPFWGWVLPMAGAIKLQKGDKESIKRMMAASRKAIDQGNSILLYAEGKRSEDGFIDTFKHGPFTLAKEKKLPIMPLVMYGTRLALPDDISQFKGYQKCGMKVLKAIPYETFADLTPKETAEMVREIMIKEYVALSV